MIVPDRCQILLYEKHGLCFVITVFDAVFIKKIKIGRRLKYGIGVRIPQCFFRMVSGKCCSYMSIEFAVRQIISGKDTITVDILHADNEIHSLPDQGCKGIKTFVTTVCHKDGIITILMKTIRSVQ